MYTYTSFRVGCHLIPTTHNIPFFIPVLHAGVLFIDFFLILRPAYLLLMEGIYTTAIAIFLAVRQNLSLARQEELWDTWARHNQNGERKGETETETVKEGETGQTCAEHAEISPVKHLHTMDQ